MLKILTLIATLLLSLVTNINAFTLSDSQKQIIQNINTKYITYKAIKSQFVQVDAKGNSTTGWFVINRPQKARIEYPQLNIRFIANAGSLLFDDLNQNQKTMLPLGASVFSYLLEEKQSLLSNNVEIVNFAENTKNNTITLTLTNKQNPQLGTLSLTLNKNTAYITGWQVKDAVGNLTTITLNNPVFTTVDIKNQAIFNIQRVRNVKFNDIK